MKAMEAGGPLDLAAGLRRSIPICSLGFEQPTRALGKQQ